MSFNRVIWTESGTDPLQQVTWTFWLYNTDLVLDSYLVETRKTIRHGFKIKSAYYRLPTGYNTYGLTHITEAEVPLTDEIKERALDKYVSQLRVVRWSEVCESIHLAGAVDRGWLRA